ncbi:unnamed protein product [Ranitomeya imitator]|uniref:Uncharacterized protein n=1 Tax=Ranitomeya imitator TaxID=111125 RepID=A0ABN9L2E1_9NEOB|nr:unnamed protein product [Ranitomeya imitator]
MEIVQKVSKCNGRLRAHKSKCLHELNSVSIPTLTLLLDSSFEKGFYSHPDMDLYSQKASLIRKDSDSGEMNDLVNLMTETLHMAKDNIQMPPAAFKEFRLNKRYRDTLMLHGRALEEQEDISFQDLAPNNLTVQEKFRRMIEALRTDVLQGLGVKVLEEAYNIMDEEDDNLKELFDPIS